MTCNTGQTQQYRYTFRRDSGSVDKADLQEEDLPQNVSEVVSRLLQWGYYSAPASGGHKNEQTGEMDCNAAAQAS